MLNSAVHAPDESGCPAWAPSSSCPSCMIATIAPPGGGQPPPWTRILVPAGPADGSIVIDLGVVTTGALEAAIVVLGPTVEEVTSGDVSAGESHPPSIATVITSPTPTRRLVPTSA